MTATNVFQAKDRLLKELKWSENPFVKDLRVQDKETFMQYYAPLDGVKIVERLAFDVKACAILGPKGVGKTSALFYVLYSLPDTEFDKIMLKEPPLDLTEMAKLCGLEKKPGVLGSILNALGKKQEYKIERAELISYIKTKTNTKKLVIFVDEVHLNLQLAMEYKYLLDEIPNLRMIFCGLELSGLPDSLVQLIGEKNIFHRNSFSKQEMLDIIAHRIHAAGGKGIAPFSQEYLNSILTEQNLLTPRYVFDELNNELAKIANGDAGVTHHIEDEFIASVVKKAKEHPHISRLTPNPNAVIIDGDAQSAKQTPFGFDVPQTKQEKTKTTKTTTRQTKTNVEDDVFKPSHVLSSITTSHAPWWQQLSPSQQQVISTLVQKDALSLNEIMEYTGLTQNTVFNALYQLRGEDAAEKKRKPDVPFPLVMAKATMAGKKKKNLYSINSKIKNLFTLH